MTGQSVTDILLFVVLPYICLFTFLLMTIHRYRAQSFSYSSLSSQFLENEQHFWTAVPAHDYVPIDHPLDSREESQR